MTGENDRLQATEAGRRQVPRDPVDAGGVGAVRRERHVDHRIVEPGVGSIGRTDRRIGGQLEDAVVILGKLELRRGAQHAVRLDPTDDAGRDGQVLARDVGAGGREHTDEAGSRIGRPADDLDGRAASRVDRAHPQAVGIGVLHGLDDASHRETAEPFRRVLDALDFEADAGQRLGDVGQRRLGSEVILEPGQGEFHGRGAGENESGSALSGDELND